ncbi:MAG: hypothetical protein ACRDX8_11235 [Acidimicrobiales bacterium]
MKGIGGSLAVLATVGLLSGCGSGGGTFGPASTASTSLASSTTPGHPGHTETTTLPTANRPVAGKVAASFQVQAATFISPQDGWVLGTTTCRPGACLPGTLDVSIARTTDAGVHWVSAPAFPDHIANSASQPPAGVDGLRFADPRNGWAYGPDLWSTHDGGDSWVRVSIGASGSRVVDLEASGGEVDAVVTHCKPSTGPCPAQLWHSPVGADHFTEVVAVSLPGGVEGSAPLALHGGTGYLLAASGGPSGMALWVTTNAITWVLQPSPCQSGSDLDSVAPIDSSQVAVLCVG